MSARTILDLGHLPTDLSQNLASPPLALPQAFARARHARASVAPRAEAKLCGLRLAEAIQHGLCFLLITGLRRVYKRYNPSPVYSSHSTYHLCNKCGERRERMSVTAFMAVNTQECVGAFPCTAGNVALGRPISRMSNPLLVDNRHDP